MTIKGHPQGESDGQWARPVDEEPVLPGNTDWRAAVRIRFFHFFNTIWLVIGLLALAGLVLFPVVRSQLLLISAWLLITFLLGLLLSKLGNGAAARAFLPLSTWLLPWAFMLVFLPRFNITEPQQVALYTLLFALLGFPILLSGTLVGRWSALVIALLNTILLTAISVWLGAFATITIGLVLLWMLLALIAWLYESALRGAQALLVEQAAASSPLPQKNNPVVESPGEPIIELPLDGLEQALSFEDRETRLHAVQVTDMTVRLAERLGIIEPEISAIRRGSLLHDIGKAAVPQQILHKPGPLNPEEWEIVRRHPEAAREMLENHLELRESLDIPYCHHERWDGTGYPRGLSGEEIPLAARIFAVVDVWDALRNDQPYRAAWTQEAAEVYIRQQSGLQFDPHIAEVFLEMLKD